MKKYFDGNAGIMLMELLIGIALITILLSALFSLFAVAITSSRIGTAKVEAQETARIALDAMVREIRTDALDIITPATNAISDSLSIQVVDNNDNTKYNTITFYLASSTLYRKLNKWDGSTGTFPLTEGTVTHLQFDVRHPRTVKISLTVQTANNSAYSLTTSVAGLNTQ